jgi:hypothetical protein
MFSVVGFPCADFHKLSRRRWFAFCGVFFVVVLVRIYKRKKWANYRFFLLQLNYIFFGVSPARRAVGVVVLLYI